MQFMMDDKDHYSREELERRLVAVIDGAFGDPPTPLKDIVPPNGEARSLKRKKSQRRLSGQLCLFEDAVDDQVAAIAEQRAIALPIGK
jgi:hypothetical protein